MLNDDIARSIARAINESRFERQGYDAKANAQRNLQGKTHYVDDDTLRFFHGRINSAHVHYNGLLFSIVESVAADMNNRSRGFRFVTFDLFGIVVNDRSNTDELCSTGAKAHDQMQAFVNSFDVLAHYKTAMLERAERLKRESAAMAKAARSIRIRKES